MLKLFMIDNQNQKIIPGKMLDPMIPVPLALNLKSCVTETIYALYIRIKPASSHPANTISVPPDRDGYNSRPPDRDGVSPISPYHDRRLWHRVACRRCPPEGKIRILIENARKMAVLGRLLVLFGWNSGPVAVLCVSGSLCKFPQRYIDHKLQVSLFHTSL